MTKENLEKIFDCFSRMIPELAGQPGLLLFELDIPVSNNLDWQMAKRLAINYASKYKPEFVSELAALNWD